MKRFSKFILLSCIVLFWFIGTYSYADATWMIITLTPGWNVISTPALLSNISFSNWWNGITFSYLESGQWMSTVPTIDIIKPLWWFLVKNSNNTDVDMILTYKDINPSESMHQKNVNIWWNLLWITTMNQPFYSISPRLYLDFTNNNDSNLLNTINTDYVAWNWNISYPEIWEAYWIFLSSNQLYWWSNNRYWNKKNLSNSDDYQRIIGVTPWSYNIPLLKWTITTDQTMSFKNAWFYIEISWANAYEDIAWYEAGWIIYDIIVKVWSCIKHIEKYKFNYQTDSLWYKKIDIPLFEECNSISTWTYDISVLIWINWEYATNFKTGMTITMNSINRYSFNNSTLDWEIESSIVEISHNNLPNLTVESSSNQTEVQISSWMSDFLLWSWVLYTTESWITANILLDFDTVNNNVLRYKMNVSTYINWELVDTTWYRNMSIKHEIPLNQNENTIVEFKGTMTSNFVWYFTPRIIVNRILKNNINFITQNCNYYRNECRQFNWWNYILHWWLLNVNWGWNNGWWNDNQWCTAEQLLACIVAEDYDDCIAHCSYNENLDVSSLITWTLSIAPWVKTVELFKAKLTSTNANWIEIRNYWIYADNFNSWLFSNLKVYIDGIPYDWDMNSSDLIFNSNDAFDIPAGTFVYIKIIWDISDGVVTDNPIRFELVLDTGYNLITHEYINLFWLSVLWPKISIISPYYLLTNDVNNSNSNIVLWNQSDVWSFNINQNIKNSELQGISFYYSWTTWLWSIISSVSLLNENFVVQNIDELPNTSTGYIVFNNLNLSILKDDTISFSLNLTAKDDFNNIWNTILFSLNTWNIIMHWSIWSWNNIQSNWILVLWNIPSLTLSNTWNNILLSVENDSVYDIDIWEIKYRILCNSNNNCIEWNAIILDTINGTEIWTSWDFPWRIFSQINSWYWIVQSTNNRTYIIQLNSNYIINPEDFTINILGLKYRYIYNNDFSSWIEQQYDISL